MSKKSLLIDAPERRGIMAGEFEFREAGDQLTLTGYASVFNTPYEVAGGPPWGWIETMDPGAFKTTLAANPDVHLLVNHDGMPLARTLSDTLQLSTDRKGLKITAKLDRSDPDVQRLAPKLKPQQNGRANMDEMSFAFRVKAQEWNDDETERRVTEVSLHKGDVSVVNFGANPATSAQLRSLLSALADVDVEAAVVEARSIGHARLAQAHHILRKLLLATKRADLDDDPMALLAGLDATLDEAVNLIAVFNRDSVDPAVLQVFDLVVAAESVVDELMELMGVVDPDDDEVGESTGLRIPTSTASKVLSREQRLALLNEI